MGDDDRDLLFRSSTEVSGQAISTSTSTEEFEVLGVSRDEASTSSFADILIEQCKRVEDMKGEKHERKEGKARAVRTSVSIIQSIKTAVEILFVTGPC